MPNFTFACIAPALLALAPIFAQAVGPYTLQAQVRLANGLQDESFGFAVAAARKVGSGQLPTAIVSGLAGRAQIYLTPFAQAGVTTLTALGAPITSGVALDSFGLTNAINQYEDFTLAAVGAPADDAGDPNPSFNSGKAYLYRSGSPASPFTPEATLAPPVLTQTGNFGTAIAISDTDVAISEPRARSSGVEVGAVHVYRKVGGSWQLQTTIFGSSIAGRFGQSVALSGNTLAIGAPLHPDQNFEPTGAIFVYIGAAANWTLQSTLFASDRVSGDRLGLAVSVDGESLLAGAANDDKTAGVDAGSAYVFTRTGNAWAEQAKLRSTQAQGNERFGQSVSLEGDEALVGAYCLSGMTAFCVGSGAAYVFKRTSGVWVSEQRIATGANEDRFGHSVAHGSNGIAIAGAFGVDASNNNQGAAYALIGLTEDIFRSGFESSALR